MVKGEISKWCCDTRKPFTGNLALYFIIYSKSPDQLHSGLNNNRTMEIKKEAYR